MEINKNNDNNNTNIDEKLKNLMSVESFLNSEEFFENNKNTKGFIFNAIRNRTIHIDKSGLKNIYEILCSIGQRVKRVLI